MKFAQVPSGITGEQGSCENVLHKLSFAFFFVSFDEFLNCFMHNFRLNSLSSEYSVFGSFNQRWVIVTTMDRRSAVHVVVIARHRRQHLRQGYREDDDMGLWKLVHHLNAELRQKCFTGYH